MAISYITNLLSNTNSNYSYITNFMDKKAKSDFDVFAI